VRRHDVLLEIDCLLDKPNGCLKHALRKLQGPRSSFAMDTYLRAGLCAHPDSSDSATVPVWPLTSTMDF